VSWVRHRDIHLLTVGRYTYTSDQRFEALHLPHAEEWTLRIRYPQRKDSGIYECQISTTPPIGHPVYLTIVVSRIQKREFRAEKIVEYKLQQGFVPIGSGSLFTLKVDGCLRGITNTKASPLLAFAFNANISPI
ncbi:unnamed protein product, partial [Heterotrigona itama]